MDYDWYVAVTATLCTQGCGTKPTSGESPKTKAAWLSDGEGEARRKAGLVECSKSLLLLLLNKGQGAALR